MNKGAPPNEIQNLKLELEKWKTIIYIMLTLEEGGVDIDVYDIQDFKKNGDLNNLYMIGGMESGMKVKIEGYKPKCPGCQRPENHKKCPAHGTKFYMSKVPFTKEIEDVHKEAIKCGIDTTGIFLLAEKQYFGDKKSKSAIKD